MELTTRTKKVTIQDPPSNDHVHVMTRFNGPTLSAYRRKLSASATFKRGGSKVVVKEVDVNLEYWKIMVVSVEGYTVNGTEVMKLDDWKKQVANLAPDHCLLALAQITSAFSENDNEEEEEECPFPSDNSKDASNDG